MLGFNLAEAGILASLPYLARLFSGFLFGSVGDMLRRSNVMDTTTIRKSFCLFCKLQTAVLNCTSSRLNELMFLNFLAHIIPGLLLLGLAFIGNNPYWCVAIITMSLGFNGASTLTNLQNSQDLAPNYAGTLYGAINFVGTTTGFLTPLVVGHFTETRVSINFRYS